jgi:hypothetical protein
MMFLLRMTFWLGVVLVVLPAGESKDSKDSPATKVSATDAVTAALGTVSDLREFCARQPNACVFGSQAAAVIGERAQSNAKLLYEFMIQRMGSKGDAPDSTGSTATRSAGVPLPTARPTNDTLAPGDFGPDWRAPDAAKHVRHARQTAPQR